MKSCKIKKFTLMFDINVFQEKVSGWIGTDEIRSRLIKNYQHDNKEIIIKTAVFDGLSRLVVNIDALIDNSISKKISDDMLIDIAIADIQNELMEMKQGFCLDFKRYLDNN